jgi:hypothetical protein
VARRGDKPRLRQAGKPSLLASFDSHRFLWHFYPEGKPMMKAIWNEAVLAQSEGASHIPVIGATEF